MTTLTQLAPHEAIWTLTNGVVASRCLHVVAELGVADHIGDLFRRTGFSDGRVVETAGAVRIVEAMAV
jgi:hypothetical protein